ncbi:MAG: hypothetical protein IKE73_05140 [Bacilli bacterium]|nr:hypothetical protein [Bacilli bacterium]
MRQKKYLLILFLFFFIPKICYANESVVVNNWNELKAAIENNNNSTIDIELSDNESNIWELDSKITISNNKTVSINASDSITIKRKNDYLGGFFVLNAGNLNIDTTSSDVVLTLDGNKENVNASTALITVQNGNLNIKNITLQNNHRTNVGGAIRIEKNAINANVSIENSLFQGNEATVGGAIYNLSTTGTLNIDNVRFLNNTAYESHGGAIYAYGNLNIMGNNTAFSNNSAKMAGGAIYVKNNCAILNGLFEENESEKDSGGAIKVDGILTMNGGIIRNNYAFNSGGGVDFDSKGNFFFIDGTIEENRADNNSNAKYFDADIYPNIKLYAREWRDDESLKIQRIKFNLENSHIRDENEYVPGTEYEGNTYPLLYANGMAITDRFIIYALIKTDNDNTVFVLADKDTLDIIKIIETEYCLGHAADLTYNPNTEEIISTAKTASGYWLAKFKINDNYEIEDFEYVSTGHYYGSIAYDYDNDRYIGIATTNRQVYIMDSNFNEIGDSFDAHNSQTTQGMGYYNGHIYVSASEAGTNSSGTQEYFSINDKRSNIIYVYDIETGELENTLYLPNSLLYGEIESVDVFHDGTLLIFLSTKINNEITMSFFTSNGELDLDKLNIKKSNYVLLQKDNTLKKINDLLGVGYRLKVKRNEEELIDTAMLASGDNLLINNNSYSVAVKGDLNNDGVITISDVSKIYRSTKGTITLSELEEVAGDYNENGTINITDVSGIYRMTK